ncbi:MAG: DUF1924 domain-containing protein [Devosiaceae bacterium]|nr:DUF1924 domain-containing protein [Devosiaceae bacterium]
MIKPIMVMGLVTVLSMGAAHAGPRETILEALAAQASADSADFTEFTAERGEQLFQANIGTGKPETPSCTSCHSNSATNAGETRAGKLIEPMAVSVSPSRYMDPEKVEKWFRRNCNSVIGRECTALEKGDFLTFMINQ